MSSDKSRRVRVSAAVRIPRLAAELTRLGQSSDAPVHGSRLSAAMQTRVVIVEDHPLMLERAPGHPGASPRASSVVGTATSGLQVEPLVSRTRPDLVLLDLQLPGLDGLSCLALLRERQPQAKVVVLSGLEDDETVEKALVGGATAYVNKSIDSGRSPGLPPPGSAGQRPLHRSAHHPRRGDAGHASEPVRRGPRRDRTDRRASSRSSTAVARGLSNRAVGEELFLSDQTVKFHLHKIYRKLDGGEPHRGGPDRAPARARRERRHSCLIAAL